MKLSKDLRWNADSVKQLVVPILCNGIYKLSCRCIGVLVHHHSGKKVVKILWNHQIMLCILNILWMLILDCKKLIDRIIQLLLDSCALIQLLWGDHCL